MRSTKPTSISRLAALSGLALAALAATAMPSPVVAATPAKPASTHTPVSEQDAAFTRMIAARGDVQRRARAEAFLRSYGDDASVTRQATAHALLGAALWRASCPGAVDGLCVDVVAPAADEGTCVPMLRERLVPRARDARLVEAALAHLEPASWLADVSPPADHDEAEVFREAIAESLVMLADRDLEALLGLEPPAGSYTLSSDADGGQALRDHVAQLIAQTGALVAAYAEVKATGASQEVLVAAARTGFAMETPAEALGSLPLPAGMDDDEETAYCEELGAIIDQMRHRAAQVYTWCIDRAQAQGLGGPAVEACGERLGVLEAAQ